MHAECLSTLRCGRRVSGALGRVQAAESDLSLAPTTASYYLCTHGQAPYPLDSSSIH